MSRTNEPIPTTPSPSITIASDQRFQDSSSGAMALTTHHLDCLVFVDPSAAASPGASSCWIGARPPAISSATNEMTPIPIKISSEVLPSRTNKESTTNPTTAKPADTPRSVVVAELMQYSQSHPVFYKDMLCILHSLISYSRIWKSLQGSQPKTGVPCPLLETQRGV